MTHNSLRLAHVWLDEYKVSVCLFPLMHGSPRLILIAVPFLSGLLFTQDSLSFDSQLTFLSVTL